MRRTTLSGKWPYLPDNHLGNTQMDAILQQETSNKGKNMSDPVKTFIPGEKYHQKLKHKTKVIHSQN